MIVLILNRNFGESDYKSLFALRHSVKNVIYPDFLKF